MKEGHDLLTGHSLVIPAFKGSPEISLTLSKTREAESRLLEAKDVNPATYADLESMFADGFNESKKVSAVVAYEITKAEKALEVAKSNFLIDTYQEKIKGLPKSQDSSDLRKAWLMRDVDYVAAQDRIDMLKAIEALIDGKIRLFDKVSSFMKKRMDLLLRSNSSGYNLYVTSGKK